jgi:hypothetical protein
MPGSQKPLGFSPCGVSQTTYPLLQYLYLYRAGRHEGQIHINKIEQRAGRGENSADRAYGVPPSNPIALLGYDGRRTLPEKMF